MSSVLGSKLNGQCIKQRTRTVNEATITSVEWAGRAVWDQRVEVVEESNLKLTG